jgi:hypothetical protein
MHVDAVKREVLIYRVNQKHQRVLFTTAPLPTAPSEVEAFMRLLGENLMLASAAARRLLDL